MSVHDLDLARFLVGEVEEVHAWASVLFDDRFAQADDWDTSLIMLKFRNGALGVVETAAPLEVGLRHPDRGRRRRSARSSSTARRRRRRRTTRKFGWEGDLYESFPDRFEVALSPRARGLLREPRRRQARRPGPGRRLETLRLALACTRSWRERRPVKLDEVTA